MSGAAAVQPLKAGEVARVINPRNICGPVARNADWTCPPKPRWRRMVRATYGSLAERLLSAAAPGRLTWLI